MGAPFPAMEMSLGCIRRHREGSPWRRSATVLARHQEDGRPILRLPCGRAKVARRARGRGLPLHPNAPFTPSSRLEAPAGVSLVADDGPTRVLPTRKRVEAPLLLTAVLKAADDLDVAAHVPTAVGQARVPGPQPRLAPARAHPDPDRTIGGVKHVGAKPIRPTAGHQARVLHAHHPAPGPVHPSATAGTEGPLLQRPHVPRTATAARAAGATVPAEVVRPPASANRETRKARKATGKRVGDTRRPQGPLVTRHIRRR